MSTIMERKRNFARLPIVLALQAVKCGFELETQSVDGSSFEELMEGGGGDDSFDQGSYNRAIETHIDYLLNRVQGIRYLRIIYNNGRASFERRDFSDLSLHADSPLIPILVELYKAYRDIKRREIVENNPGMTFSVWASNAQESIQQILDAVGSFRQKARLYNLLDQYYRDRTPTSDYYTSCNDNNESDLKIDGLPKGILAKRDGSVDGPEFIVDGPGTSASNFSSLLKKLLKAFDVVVDVGCSFHIHLSVPGIDHKYGKMLQCRMMEYLLCNVHRVPEGVQKRWKADTGYFKPQIDHDKYSFVHYHQDCRTWEFRCFGNVSTARDGLVCLKLAVEALQFAYKVEMGEAKSLFKSAEDWSSELFQDVIVRGSNLAVSAKAKRSQRLRNQAA